MKGERIILAAHRGDVVTCPENTLPAFKKAIEFGADMIETDVHMSKDGELVIMHDRGTSRLTGFDGDLNSMTLEEIRKLDAGGYFSEEFKNTPIPTVKEFIELVKDSDILINWELKDYPCDLGVDFAFKSADKLIELIEENGLTERSMVNSFSDLVLEHIYKNHKGKFVIHGQGIYNCQRHYDAAETLQTELYDWCCLYPEEKGKQPLDFPRNFGYCIENGVIPCVCVPDKLELYRKYIELGCKMFTSNNIYEADKILKLLNKRCCA